MPTITQGSIQPITLYGQIFTVDSPNITIIQGIVNRQIQQGKISTNWNIKTGGESEVIYTGTEAQVKTAALACQSSGLGYHIQGGSIWQINITFPFDILANTPTDDPIVTSWEISNSQIEQNLLECKDLPLISNLTSDMKYVIENNMKNPNGASFSVPCIPNLPNGQPNPQYINALVTQHLKFSGVEGRLRFVPTLKRTIIVPSYYVGDWSTEANGTVMTTQTLLNLYGNIEASVNNPLGAMPQWLINILPTQLTLLDATTEQEVLVPDGLESLNGFVPQRVVGSDGIVTFVGWLEYPPEYQTISLNKVQISQQWIFNQWSAGIWGLYDYYTYPATDLTSLEPKLTVNNITP